MSQIKVTYIDHCGSDLTTVNSARVSFGKHSSYDEGVCGEWSLPDADKKLIRYLAEHKHYSPFGHCFASFHVKAPVFVRAQLVKHEYLRVNEISRRYVDTEPEFYTPEYFRNSSSDKKQGSGTGQVKRMNWLGRTVDIDEMYWQSVDIAKENYTGMIRAGVAPEMARMVLPQSMMTEWYWSGSLDAFANMCNLRLPEDSQYESRLVAQQISAEMLDLYPVSWNALIN